MSQSQQKSINILQKWSWLRVSIVQLVWLCVINRVEIQRELMDVFAVCKCLWGSLSPHLDLLYHQKFPDSSI